MKKRTIINDIRNKDHYVHNLPENRNLLAYARENRRAGNMAVNASWNRFTKRCFMVSILTGRKSSETTLWIIMSMRIMKTRNKNAYITTPPFGHPF